MKILFYHRQSVNAIPLSISFPLPSVRFSKRSPIHVGSLEGFKLSPANCKRFTAYHILSFADVGDCQGISLWNSLVSCFSLIETLTQALIAARYRQSVCDWGAASRCCRCGRLSGRKVLCGSLVYCFCLTETLTQVLIAARYCRFVCELKADVSTRRHLSLFTAVSSCADYVQV